MKTQYYSLIVSLLICPRETEYIRSNNKVLYFFYCPLYDILESVVKSVQIGQMDLTEFLHLMISFPVVELKLQAVFNDFIETLCFFL